MGKVLQARDPILARDVAIKILRDDLNISHDVREGLIVRMRHEAQAAARVSHPNLVTLHDMGEDADVGLYLVFEFVNGPNLKDRLRTGRLPPLQAARLARELGNALAVAHLAGVLHRDVKPENVMLSATGAKVSDFGIARIPDSTLTRTGSLLGTPAYCAPEALSSGAFSAESDQFSLAATLYEGVSGERAFSGDDAVGVAAKIQTEDPRPIARRLGLSDEVDDILMRGLDKDPTRRFASTAELGESLAAALERSMAPQARSGSLSSISGDARGPRGSGDPPASRPVRVAVGGVTIAVVSAFLGYAASQGVPFFGVGVPLPAGTTSASASASSSSEPPPTRPPSAAHRPRLQPSVLTTKEGRGAGGAGSTGAAAGAAGAAGASPAGGSPVAPGSSGEPPTPRASAAPPITSSTP
jgi:eukaryotic-like serine/threonine-protein kinase